MLNSAEIFIAGAELFSNVGRTDMPEKSIITFRDYFTDAPKILSSSVGCISQIRESGNSWCLGSHGVTHSVTHCQVYCGR
jgi:hypothetical protein